MNSIKTFFGNLFRKTNLAAVFLWLIFSSIFYSLVSVPFWMTRMTIAVVFLLIVQKVISIFFFKTNDVWLFKEPKN